MMGLLGHVRLPEVLQVMVVGYRPTALDLSEYASATAEIEVPVGPCARNEAVLRIEDAFFRERKIDAQPLGHKFLDCLTLRVVDVNRDDALGDGVET